MPGLQIYAFFHLRGSERESLLPHSAHHPFMAVCLLRGIFICFALTSNDGINTVPRFSLGNLSCWEISCLQEALFNNPRLSLLESMPVMLAQKQICSEMTFL